MSILNTIKEKIKQNEEYYSADKYGETLLNNIKNTQEIIYTDHTTTTDTICKSYTNSSINL